MEAKDETPETFAPKQLEGALEEATVCQDYQKSMIKILQFSQHGLGATWLLRCKNTKCRSHEFPTKLHTSKKQGRMLELNRAAVLAFRAIGKGFCAANKFCIIVNVP